MEPPRSSSVLRLRAVVESIEPSRPSPSAPEGERSETIHVRDLRLASTGKPLDPATAQLPHLQTWQDAGVQVGDTVLFTTTSSYRIHHNNQAADEDQPPNRQLTRVLAERAEDVVVIRRPKDATTVAAVMPMPTIEPEDSLSNVDCSRHDSEPISRYPNRLPLAAISLVLAALAGGVMGWNLAYRQMPHAPTPTPARPTS